MDAKIVLLVIAAIACTSYVAYASPPEMTCKQFVASLTKLQLSGISSCSKSMKFKNAKEKAAKMNCILKCVMMKEGILNKEGLFDEAAFNGFIDNILPPNLREASMPILHKCIAKSTGLDPTEDNCKSYDPFIKCLLGYISELCKVA